MKKREGLCIDLCFHFLIFSIYKKVLVVEAVLLQLNSMPTYVILFGSERELLGCLLDLLSPSSIPQQKRSQWPAQFLPLPSAPAAGLTDVDWRMVHTLLIKAKHVITKIMLCPFLPQPVLRHHSPLLALLYFSLSSADTMHFFFVCVFLFL